MLHVCLKQLYTFSSFTEMAVNHFKLFKILIPSFNSVIFSYLIQYLKKFKITKRILLAYFRDTVHNISPQFLITTNTSN